MDSSTRVIKMGFLFMTGFSHKDDYYFLKPYLLQCFQMSKVCKLWSDNENKTKNGWSAGSSFSFANIR